MTSSNGNIFNVTGPLCWEFTGHRWIPLTKAIEAELWCFPLICAWINAWVNNREDGDLRRHRAHHDVIVMCTLVLFHWYWGNGTNTTCKILTVMIDSPTFLSWDESPCYHEIMVQWRRNYSSAENGIMIYCCVAIAVEMPLFYWAMEWRCTHAYIKVIGTSHRP